MISRSPLVLGLSIVLLALAPLCPALAADEGEGAERERIIHGLEMGFEAAQRLGDRELAAVLERALDRVRRGGENDGAERERREARRQLEILRSARPALAEGERHDAVDLLDRAIRVRELALEGHRGEEMDALRREAPDRETLIEILSASAALWERFGHEEKARSVGELASQLRRHGRERAGEPREDRGSGERERSDREILRRLERMEERMASIERQIESLRGDRRAR